MSEHLYGKKKPKTLDGIDKMMSGCGSTDWSYYVDEYVDDMIARIYELEYVCNHAIQFIENGVEFGYIWIPDPEVNNPATDLLPRLYELMK